MFVPTIWRDWSGLTHLIGDPARLEREAGGLAWWPQFEAVRDRERFFHWELEFPEVVLEGARGFDAVLGNPPWSKVLPAKHDFFARVDPLIRAFDGVDLDRRIAELEGARPSLMEEFASYRERTTTVAKFLRKGGDFPLSEARSQAAHEDVSKYFVDRAARLVGAGGAVGFLVPSVVYNGDGCVGIRRFLLEATAIQRFYGFENRRKIFPIHSSYKFVSLVFHKVAPVGSFEAAFMRHDLHELAASEPKPWMVRITPSEIRAHSPQTLAFLEYRSQRDQEIIRKMAGGRRRLGDTEAPGAWGARFMSWRDHAAIFNVSEDRDLWGQDPTDVLGADVGHAGETTERMREKGFWPVFEDRHVQQSLVGAKPVRRWLSVEAATRKYAKSPRQEPTLVFHEQARNTDERTCIAAVLPAQSAGTHTLCGLLVEHVELDAAATVLNSLCFDYALRLRVAGRHVSFTYMRPMPVPPTEVVNRLPQIPTHLAWETGLKHITDDRSLWPVLWDANRAVAEAYGLSPDDFEHILASFPGMARKRPQFSAFLRERLQEWKKRG